MVAQSPQPASELGTRDSALGTSPCPRVSQSPRPELSPQSSAPSPLPPLTAHESHLLSAFLIYRFDLATLADREKLHPTQLLAFAHSKAVQAHLRELRRFADEAFHLRSLESKTIAIDLLEEVAKKSTDLVEKRRAASAILRGLNPVGGVRVGRASGPPWNSSHLHSPHDRTSRSAPDATNHHAAHDHTASSEPGRPRPGSDHPVHSSETTPAHSPGDRDPLSSPGPHESHSSHRSHDPRDDLYETPPATLTTAQRIPPAQSPSNPPSPEGAAVHSTGREPGDSPPNPKAPEGRHAAASPSHTGAPSLASTAPSADSGLWTKDSGPSSPHSPPFTPHSTDTS